MVKLIKNRFVLATFCMLFGLSILANTAPALAGGEPIDENFALFSGDPYPIGPNIMNITFRHDSYCNMYIYLTKFDSPVTFWVIKKTERSGYRIYNASDDGVWRLEVETPIYGWCLTDETRDTFNIPDPAPSQNNLGTDWARHPTNWDIYAKAIEILNHTTTSYEAAHNIYHHVLDHYPGIHSGEPMYPPSIFRGDLKLLSEVNTYPYQYNGTCRPDAVILTSYARALGIPARIIRIYFKCNDPQLNDDWHYFAEFSVWNDSAYVWVPVDGNQQYNWFDFPEANEKISDKYPDDTYTMTDVGIVTRIPTGWSNDWNVTAVHYPSSPYSNHL